MNSNFKNANDRRAASTAGVPRSQTNRSSNVGSAISFLIVLALLISVGSFAANGGFAADKETPENNSAADAATLEAIAAGDPDSAADSEKTPVQNESKFGDVPVKWLPDLRVFAGAPPVDVDLIDAIRLFCDEGYFGGESGSVAPEDVELSLILDGGSIAKSELRGTKLRVVWNSATIGKDKIVVKAQVKGDEARRAFVSFAVESWTPNYWAIFGAALGGLGLFLLGMKRTSDGLQAIAGSRLRRMVSLFTNNRLLAVGVGIVTTALVQSSSATTVIVLGFVNSGLMTITQAIGVIMGAHIGTSTTGWLLALNVGALGLPIVGVAGFIVLFSNSERLRSFATLALGFGLIFFGLETMGSGLADLPEIPDFVQLMRAFEATDLWGATKCVLIGCAATALVQSSAATLAIAMTLATLGAIEFNSAAALVIGGNVGTTVTALLASIGGTTNARRAAYFHTLCNAVGACWTLLVFFPFFVPAVEGLGDAFKFDVVGRIALAHSFFNIANTLVFLPFVGPIANLLTKYVKDKKTNQKRVSVTGLDINRADEPGLGIELSRGAVARMFADCRELAEGLKTLETENFENADLLERSFALEDRLDYAQDETIEFISRLTSRGSSKDFADSAREQVRVAEELETISDYLVGVLKSNLKLKENGIDLPKEAAACFGEFLGYASETLDWIEKCFADRKHKGVVMPMSLRRARYVGRVKTVRDSYLKTMFDDKLNPLAIVALDYQLNAWRRIYEHLQNIADSMERVASV